jgi:hypothetical protein
LSLYIFIYIHQRDLPGGGKGVEQWALLRQPRAGWLLAGGSARWRLSDWKETVVDPTAGNKREDGALALQRRHRRLIITCNILSPAAGPLVNKMTTSRVAISSVAKYSVSTISLT